LVFAACLLANGVAHAEDDSEKAQARMLLGQGNALFEKGDLKGALVMFRAAYAVYPSPKLLVNVAAAERELGDLAGAANDLQRFIDEVPDLFDEPQLLERARTDLRGLERRLGRIAFEGWPPRTMFEVDGKVVRDPHYVRPGDHHVRIRVPTGEEDERDVTLAAGESSELSRRADLLPRRPPEVAPQPTARRSRLWIAVVVGGALLIGAGVGIGVGLAAAGAAHGPLTGDLGTARFSDFR
jgi:hypothetical protein